MATACFWFCGCFSESVSLPVSQLLNIDVLPLDMVDWNSSSNNGKLVFEYVNAAITTVSTASIL